MIRLYKAREYKGGTPMVQLKERNISSITALFANIDGIVAKIDESERWNIHYSIAHVEEGNARKFISQDVIPFDIDGIDTDRVSEYISIVTTVLGVNSTEIGIVMSGNGLHFLILMNKSFNTLSYFKENKLNYKKICSIIGDLLKEMELPFKDVDTNVFRPAATLRLPMTKNIKKGKPDKDCIPINKTLKPIQFDLSLLAGQLSGYSEGLQDNELKSYPTPDTNGVLTCPFLMWCKEHQEEVSEPQWYAMLSILSRLDGGLGLCHEYSMGNPTYNQEECDVKIERALNSSGPRTCFNINSLWDGCTLCEHRANANVISPINIISPDFIKTRNTGFHNVTISVNKETGQKISKVGKPNFEDLRKYYEQINPYKTVASSKCVYIYRNGVWEIENDSNLEGFAQEHFKPKANTSMCNEFRNLIQRTNLVQDDWINPTGLINLQNGVLNMDTLELLPTSKDYGFTYQMPYSYDGSAKCDRFDQFMREITLDRKDLADVLLEFAGYALSNSPCRYEKILILLGEGSNGKSTFMKVLKNIVGETNYSALTMDDFNKDTSRYLLYNKLFNLSEETPRKSFFDSSIIKNLATGGDVVIKMLYKQQFSYKNKTKLITATNDMPFNTDVSHGMFRRLLIIPFDAEFEGEAKDRYLDEKLELELSGILNRIIEGYKRLITNNRFTDSWTANQELVKYKDQSDPIHSWASDRVEIVKNDEAFTPSIDMYQDYLEYCSAYKLYEHSFMSFSKGLKRVFKSKAEGRAICNDRGKLRGYNGIRLIVQGAY